MDTNQAPAWQKLTHAVSTSRLMDDVRSIAQWVRLTGSDDERKAFRYIEDQLKQAGLETALYLHDAYVSFPVAAELSVKGGDGSSFPCITHSFGGVTPERGVTAEPVLAGGGSQADLAAAQCEGRIAVITGLAMPARVQAAEACGAIGAVFLNQDPHVHEMIVSTVWGSPDPGTVADLPQIPVISLANEDGLRLQQLIKSGNVCLTLRTEVETGWRQIPLLTADIPGAVDDAYILLAGHVDSWHCGAMDNASANATMLEVARLLAEQTLYRGLRLAFWSGHSHARYAGSAWYADRFWHDLDRRCAAHVYIDSVGGRGATLLSNGYAMPETHAVAAETIKALTGQLFEGSPVGRSGDQSFLGIGIPSLLMTVSEHPEEGPEASRDFALGTGAPTGGLGWWWHTAEDTIDKIDPDNLRRDAQIYLACITVLCTDPVLPLNYAAAANDLLALVRRSNDRVVAAGLGVDLTMCLDAGTALVEAAERLEAMRRRVAQRWPADADRSQAKISTDMRRITGRLNSLLMQLGRVLIPIRYTRVGRFAHDPATALAPLPPLAAADRLSEAATGELHMAAVALRRGANLVRDALCTASSEIDRNLAEIEAFG